MPENTTPTPNRRAALRGICWTAPVAAVSVAAPAMAVSPEPGLVGLIQARYRASGLTRTASFALDSTDDRVDELGLRVTDVPSAPTFAELTFYASAAALPRGTRWGRRIWNGWQAPEYLRTEGGLTVWRIRYEGGWRQVGRTYHAEPLQLSAGQAGYTREPVQVRMVRRVTVGGIDLVTDSQLRTLGQSAAARRAASEEIDAGELI